VFEVGIDSKVYSVEGRALQRWIVKRRQELNGPKGMLFRQRPRARMMREARQQYRATRAGKRRSMDLVLAPEYAVRLECAAPKGGVGRGDRYKGGIVPSFSRVDATVSLARKL
jgi:hypothetical protein